MKRLETDWVELLMRLTEAGVDFIVVGGVAAILNDVIYRTEDIDIVHRRSPENIQRLAGVLESLDAYFRNDLMQRKLRPRLSDLAGHGHLLLRTALGQLDVLCEISGQRGYEELLGHTRQVVEGPLQVLALDLPMLIQVKTEAGRDKDFQALPTMLATLEERRRRK
jgi:predicted nucleotidyltransferase